MRTKVYVTLLIILSFFSSTFISCGDGMGDCPDFVPPFFAIQSMNIANAQMLDERNEANRFVVGINEDESVSWNSFFLSIYFDVEYHAQKQPYSPKGGASLYALSCSEPGEAGSKQKLDTLYLVALEDYNDNFLKNDTLNSILTFRDWPPAWPKDLDRFSSLDYYTNGNKEGIRVPYLYLKLEEAPKEDMGEYRFKLIYILQDNTVFEAETEKVILHK